MKQNEKETGRQWWTIYMMDLENLKWNEKQFRIITGPYRCLVSIALDHFVETSRKFIVLNAPSFIHYIWQTVKTFVPQGTKNKVIIPGKKIPKQLIDYYGCAVPGLGHIRDIYMLCSHMGERDLLAPHPPHTQHPMVTSWVY